MTATVKTFEYILPPNVQMSFPFFLILLANFHSMLDYLHFLLEFDSFSFNEVVAAVANY